MRAKLNSMKKIREAQNPLISAWNWRRDNIWNMFTPFHIIPIMVDFDFNMQGMNNYIASNQSYLNFNWAFDVPRQERPSRFGEDRYTNITYKFYEDEVDNLSQNKSDEENLNTRVKWIGFKQLFFNSTIIADESFPNAFVRSTKFEDDPKYLANFYADIAIPYEGTANEQVGMQFYFGPNHYQTLKQYSDLNLERMVYLGYAIVRPVINI